MYHVVYFKCDASGDPVCTPDYYDDGAPSVNVIHWDTNSYEEDVTVYAGFVNCHYIVLIHLMLLYYQVIYKCLFLPGVQVRMPMSRR